MVDATCLRPDLVSSSRVGVLPRRRNKLKFFFKGLKRGAREGGLKVQFTLYLHFNILFQFFPFFSLAVYTLLEKHSVFCSYLFFIIANKRRKF